MGDVLIQQAKKMGAKTFVHISFPGTWAWRTSPAVMRF